MNQKQKLLEYARSKPEGFTNLEAAHDLWIGCPWKRREELEDEGYIFEKIGTESESGAKFLRYRLIGEPLRIAPKPEPMPTVQMELVS